MTDDNIIKLKIKHVEGEQEYQSQQIDNIQSDIQLLLNVRVPELRGDIHIVNNNIKSLTELSKSRDIIINSKLDKIMDSNNFNKNFMWLNIIFSAIVIGYCLFH